MLDRERRRGPSRRALARLLQMLLFIPMTLGGCSAPETEPTTAEIQAVRDTVLRLEEAMNSAVDALDCDAGLTHLGEREPIFVSLGHVVRTAGALREACEEMVAGRTGARFEIDARTANVLSEDTAFVVREGDYTIDRIDGTSSTIYLVMTTVWHRDDDGWKMVHLHESIVPPDLQDSTGGE